MLNASASVNNLRGNNPGHIESDLAFLKDLSIDLENYENDMDSKLFEQMFDFIFDTVGFNHDALETYELYMGFLGKTFSNFINDFWATGNSFTDLPLIKKRYSNLLDEKRLRSIIGYLGKKRTRDLIDPLASNQVSDYTTRYILKALDPHTSKKNIVKVLVNLHKTYDLLNKFNSNNLIDSKLEGLPENVAWTEIISELSETRKLFYGELIGMGVEVPKELELQVDNILYAYHNKGSDETIKSSLKLIASKYLLDGKKASFDAIRDVEPNKILREFYYNLKIDIDSYECGIKRNYTIKSDPNIKERIEERIDSEFEIIYDRLKKLRIDESSFSHLYELSIADKVSGIESILKTQKSVEKDNEYISEIKGHMQKAKSIKGSFKEIKDDVDFYVSTDPFEALHMGDFFGSCLSLKKGYGGFNRWASIVQVMDSNKNVIYAKGSKGDYVGRNRTALTDGGILCTRFFQNGSLDLDGAWVDYLTDYGAECSQDILIPTRFVSNKMFDILDNLVKEGSVIKEKKSLLIEPAYFKRFYGDGLDTTELDDGTIQVKTAVYNIKFNSN